MTATLVPTVPTTDAPARSLLRAGIVAGLVAAVATTAVAAIAHAAGVSLETAPGEQIPVLGFGTATFEGSMGGQPLVKPIVGAAAL